jgi:flavin-dependent dehydrogenase
MSRRPWDVVVLGGGPAGAATAALCAAAGAKTLVLERDAFPRDKVCGEFLSGEGVDVLRRLGALDALAGLALPAMDGCLLSDDRGREVASSLPDLPGSGRRALGISRERMDLALLDLARRRGAVVRERCEAAAPVLHDGRVTGVRLRAHDEIVRARIVVAADGRRSIVQRALAPAIGDPLLTTEASWYGFKVHLRGDATRLCGRVELHLFDGGYAGLGAIEGGRINLCFLATVATLRACRGEPARIVAERILANPAARSRLEGSVEAGSWKTIGPLRFGARRAALSGALLVGDAAGTIDPFAGEGMSHALLGAELAAPFALTAARDGALSPRAARRWQSAWTAAFARTTRRARAVGWLFERPRIGRLALAAVAAGPDALLSRLVAATRTGAAPSLT